MFYHTELKDYIRVSPRFFGKDVDTSVLKSIKQKYDGFIDTDLGIVVDVVKIIDVKDGVIIPGDGAAYYETIFEVLSYKPEMQELVVGKIKDIADFGAFITLGPIDGMIHISQTMDDFVSFAKDKVLTGKESGRFLRVNDKVRARMIAISFKDIANPKIGLTMRQPGLGRPEWSEEDAAGGPKKEKKPKKGKDE